MNVQNNVTRILINPDSVIENEFDKCLIETKLGDVFVFMCVPVLDKLCQYKVSIYKTAIFVGDEENQTDELERVIDTSEPVYTKEFCAVTPFFKRGYLSDMLDCMLDDDADTWEKLRKEFGHENVSSVHEPRRQIAVC